jgi:bla regulator protein BlaR1
VPQVLMSSAVESPAVTGLLRPLLLLPAGFPRGFSDAEARLILLHEFTHVKRRDLPVNWLVCVLHSMHWFNPLLWFAFARMREDRELACDAQVLSLGKTDRRADYGHALLKLQLCAPASTLSLGFVGIFERNSNLRTRITDISTHRKSHPGWRAAGIALTGVLTLLGATEAQERKPKDPRQVAIEKKLDAIKLPRVSFKDSSVEEAVDFLRLRANELDPAPKNQAERGVNFVIKAPKDFQVAPVTLELKDVSLRKAIENVAEASGLAMTVDPFAVTLSPRTAAEKGAGKLKGKAMEMASDIVIPVLDFESVSLAEAVEFLNGKAAELAEEGKAPVIELSANANKDAAIKELRLRNVPLSEAVKYISEAAKEPLSADDEVIRFGK